MQRDCNKRGLQCDLCLCVATGAEVETEDGLTILPGAVATAVTKGGGQEAKGGGQEVKEGGQVFVSQTGFTSSPVSQ
eukprot:2409399-Prymnesium_polylepis.1